MYSIAADDVFHRGPLRVRRNRKGMIERVDHRHIVFREGPLRSRKRERRERYDEHPQKDRRDPARTAESGERTTRP